MIKNGASHSSNEIVYLRNSGQTFRCFNIKAEKMNMRDGLLNVKLEAQLYSLPVERYHYFCSFAH